MRRSSPFVSRDRSAEMDSTMTPMIDVVFLLLVFFVWTASFQVVEHILPSQVSAETGNDPADPLEPKPQDDFEKVVIRIGFDGQQPTWTVRDSQLGSLDEVRDMLNQMAAVKTDAPVILHPAGVVPLGHVIAVYDLSRQSGFQKVSFAVNPQ